MRYAEPRDSCITGDWLPEGTSYVGKVVSTWSGGVEWLATREVAEHIVRDQELMLAELDELSRKENTILEWDGDVLVETQLPGYPEDREVHRHEPDENGLYWVGFGWTWYICDDQYDPADPTPAQLEAFNTFKQHAIFGTRASVRIIDSMSRIVHPDRTHEFPVNLWDGNTEALETRSYHSVHVATVTIDRKGKITVKPIGA